MPMPPNAAAARRSIAAGSTLRMHGLPRVLAAVAIAMLAATASASSTSAAAGPQEPAFAATAMRFDSCCQITSLATADLNGDGVPDVVTGNGLRFRFAVLLGGGAGSFEPPVYYPVGLPQIGHVAVAIADVDGDGIVDVVAAGTTATGVWLYPGDGNGGFDAPIEFDLGGGRMPRALALADVDEDGAIDIIAANAETDDVSVLLGDGSGGFAPPSRYAVGQAPEDIAWADLNGDGRIDLVTANRRSRDVSVLFGLGGGFFSSAIHLGIGPFAEPITVAIADVTGDGHPDLVTANAGDDGTPFPPPELPGTVSIVAGDGGGGFAPAIQRPAGPGDGRAQGIAIADLAGDGYPDVVVSRPLANRISILRGDAEADYTVLLTRPAGYLPGPIQVADVTGDGQLDVVTGSTLNINVLPGNGLGDLGLAGNFDAGRQPHAVVAVDLDHDGFPDIVTANFQANTISILRNNGIGEPGAPIEHAVGANPSSLAAGDLNHDGHIDLVVANFGAGSVSVLLGDGDGGFAPGQTFSVATTMHSPYAITLGDANGDGHLDIATANTNVFNHGASVLLGDGSGGFSEASVYSVSAFGFPSPHGVLLSDVTGDGHADLVTANLGSNNLSLLAGDGSGAFAAAQHLNTGTGPVMVLSADVTGDGHVDLVTLDHAAQTVSVLAADGVGGFEDAVSFAIASTPDEPDLAPWPWGMALADVDGDGLPDIVTANTQADRISLLLNDGDGEFSPFMTVDTGARPGAVAVADIDGDGRPDIVTANRMNDTVSVLLNRSGAGDRIFVDGFEPPVTR